MNVDNQRTLPRHFWLVALAGAIVAAATRAIRLSTPHVLVFDEAYYAVNAWEIASSGVEQGTVVHPPLAKWMMAGGIRIVGFSPWGWRVVVLLAGAATVALTVQAAGITTRSRRLAGLAGLIVLTDGIAFVTGRLALLDGIVALFATVILTMILVVANDPTNSAMIDRILWPLAVVCGAAMACKWSAAPLWLIAAGTVGWASALIGGPVGRRLGVVLIVPPLVYALSFVPTLIVFTDSGVYRLACGGNGRCGTSPIDRLTALIDYHVDVIRYHRDLRPTNPYAVSSLNWIPQTQPTVLYDDTIGHRVVMQSNPLVWLAGSASIALGVLTRRFRTPTTVVLAVAALAWWAPWAVGSRAGYSFYAAPLVPILALSIVTNLGTFSDGTQRRIGAAMAVICVIGVVALYPRWTAL